LLVRDDRDGSVCLPDFQRQVEDLRPDPNNPRENEKREKQPCRHYPFHFTPSVIHISDLVSVWDLTPVVIYAKFMPINGRKSPVTRCLYYIFNFWRVRRGVAIFVPVQSGSAATLRRCFGFDFGGLDSTSMLIS